MLLAQLLPVPGNSVRIEFVCDFADVGIDHRDATVTAPIPVARQRGCSYLSCPGVPPWVPQRIALRVLARFRIGETTAGEMPVSEGLARAWRGRMEKWCGG